MFATAPTSSRWPNNISRLNLDSPSPPSDVEPDSAGFAGVVIYAGGPLFASLLTAFDQRRGRSSWGKERAHDTLAAIYIKRGEASKAL